MAVQHSTDDNLRKLGSADKYTIVKYDNGRNHFSSGLECEFEMMSNHSDFHGIKFLVIHSNENPVARQEVELKKMPFLSIYSQGFLIDCGSVRSGKGIERFLKKLKSLSEKKKPHPVRTTVHALFRDSQPAQGQRA